MSTIFETAILHGQQATFGSAAAPPLLLPGQQAALQAGLLDSVQIYSVCPDRV
jgi:hypothetical protein